VAKESAKATTSTDTAAGGGFYNWVIDCSLATCALFVDSYSVRLLHLLELLFCGHSGTRCEGESGVGVATQPHVDKHADDVIITCGINLFGYSFGHDIPKLLELAVALGSAKLTDATDFHGSPVAALELERAGASLASCDICPHNNKSIVGKEQEQEHTKVQVIDLQKIAYDVIAQCTKSDLQHALTTCALSQQKQHYRQLQHQLPSLKTSSKFLLQCDMCKDQQCSEWGKRPLSSDQLQYAALDAQAMLVLSNVLLRGSGS
jgi:hypothetical protein